MAVPMPVAPLFEMKKDLENAGDVLRGELARASPVLSALTGRRAAVRGACRRFHWQPADTACLCAQHAEFRGAIGGKQEVHVRM